LYYTNGCRLGVKNHTPAGVLASDLMALGEFTKQLAQQAILSATEKPARETPAPAAENLGAVFFAQIAAMQKALKEDEELALYFLNGAERIRVMEIFLPSPGVAVLSGLDQDRVFARAISAVGVLQLIVRVQKAAPGAKPVRVALIVPKS
jgi:hypothetical protein